MIRLHDTAAGAVLPLEPRDPGKVSMYVCGPTVYGPPHLGHGRFSLVFDVLRRYLEWSGFDVTYVSNITDIEDKIIERAQREGRDWQRHHRQVRGHLVPGDGCASGSSVRTTTPTPRRMSNRW